MGDDLCELELLIESEVTRPSLAWVVAFLVDELCLAAGLLGRVCPWAAALAFASAFAFAN